MCGICGIISYRDSDSVDEALVGRMCSAMKHRGPNDEGLYMDLANMPRVGLGHRRLSIIDTSSAGHQPMVNEDGSMIMVFNGEIYNHKELRMPLEGNGHRFKSGTDIETVLHLYEEEGSGCLKRLNGMFAFAIWDIKNRSLFCARDRFGELPLYYRFDGQKFTFASELKAFLQDPGSEIRPNDAAIYTYISQPGGYSDVLDESFFKGIYSLKPGHYLTLKDCNVVVKKYWELPLSREKNEADEKKLTETFYGLLEDAVRIRLSSDVPIAFYLSGGLDSSSVVSLAKKIKGGTENLKCFTLTFPDRSLGETEFAEEVARFYGLSLHETLVKGSEVFNELPGIIRHMEEPFKNLRVYSQWCILKDMVNQKAKVIINGEGGDEFLLGYSRFNYFFFADLLAKGRLPEAYREISGFCRIHGLSPVSVFVDMLRVLKSDNPGARKRILNNTVRRTGVLNKDFASRHNNESMSLKKREGANFVDNEILRMVMKEPIPHTLHINDRVNMAFSMESRAPFLDYRLAEFCSNLPSTLRIKNGISKYILRSALKGILPAQVVNRTVKKGFPSLTGRWLKSEMKLKVTEIFNSPEFRNRGYLDQDRVLEIYAEHCGGKKDMTYSVWPWLNLELWFREFFDKSNITKE